jgi:hypothetical protein
MQATINHFLKGFLLNKKSKLAYSENYKELVCYELGLDADPRFTSL